MSYVVRKNTEYEALASAVDTATGRTSDWLTNENGKGILVVLNITDTNGTGEIQEFSVDAPAGESGYVPIAYAGPLSITSGIALFCVYPYADTLAVGDPAAVYFPVRNVVPRTFRIRITSATDAVGNDLTYSVDVYTIP